MPPMGRADRCVVQQVDKLETTCGRPVATLMRHQGVAHRPKQDTAYRRDEEIDDEALGASFEELLEMACSNR